MAGQNSDCSNCGHQLEVPQLKALRELDSATAEQPAANKSTAPNPLRNFLFVAGLLLLLLGLISSLGLYAYSSGMIVDFSSSEQQIDERAAVLTPGGVLREWYIVEAQPDLPEWQENLLMRYHKQGLILRRIGYGFAAVGAVGMVLLVASALVGSGKR